MALRADTRAGIGACRRNLDRDIGLAPGTSEGASFGFGGAISATGVETVREREQNARNEAFTAVVRRVCMWWG